MHRGLMKQALTPKASTWPFFLRGEISRGPRFRRPAEVPALAVCPGGCLSLDPVTQEITAELMALHGCHTVILYGSRARGDATPASDFDLLCVRTDGPAVRDARWSGGHYIDAFVYPESTFHKLDPPLLRILGGVIVRERAGFGTALLARLQELFNRGPEPLPEDERSALFAWAGKTLERLSGPPTAETGYRRVAMLSQSLEDYFALRQRWYRGSKESLAWLQVHDPESFGLFDRAVRLGASLDEVSALVRRVYDPANARAAPLE